MKTITVSLLASVTFYVGFSQSNDCVNTIEIEGVETTAINLDYLSAIQDHNTPEPIKALENWAANYDINDYETFGKDHDSYSVVFEDDTNGNGSISANYDKSGKILNCHEKFEAVTPPFEVRNAIYKEHPGWDLYSSSYVASYSHGKEPKKHYKIKLRKNRAKKSLKLDNQGNYLN